MNINEIGSVNQRVRFYLNQITGTFRLTMCDECAVYYVKDNKWEPFVLSQPVVAPTAYEGLMSIVATKTGIQKAVIEHDAGGGTDPEKVHITYYALVLRLSVDSDRDGVIDDSEHRGNKWVWGANQHGAIVLVNNDRDFSDFHPDVNHKSELAPLLIHDPHINALPEKFSIRLFCTPRSANRFSVYRVTDGQPEVILGRTTKGQSLSISAPLTPMRQELYIEGHEFPGPFFEGLITIELQLVEEVPGGSVVRASERVVFRVAPWVMTPNHLPVKKVYVCDMAGSNYPNPNFLAELKKALNNINVPHHVVPPNVNGGDRWIQDEVEFGYSMAPNWNLPVVFDSPRDRELDGFPEASLLGPDFGHFQIGGSRPNSLDSFGNLEVSPPVTVNGRLYPLGRIVFGGSEYGSYSADAREMMPEIRQFLYAQKVQSPVEIYTDWLAVGHVDEIICFVPADNDIKFQLLMASPDRAHSILKRLRAGGHDHVMLFQGRNRLNGKSAERTVGDLLDDQPFWTANNVYQQHQNLNRDILKRELGIDEKDIIEIPVLFYPPSTNRTLAYFPDMVNQLVIGKYSLVPKPYGPVVGDVDQFEKAISDALPEREVVFIEDWYAYHELSGEVHCGTNCLREPPPVKWWEHRPEGGFDI